MESMKIFHKLAIAKELFLMIKDRRAWLLLPILLAILFITIFIFVVELPALFPFFYAIF